MAKKKRVTLLREEEVRQIRAWHQENQITQKEMAKRLKTSPNTIGKVIAGEYYAWVKDEPAV